MCFLRQTMLKAIISLLHFFTNPINNCTFVFAYIFPQNWYRTELIVFYLDYVLYITRIEKIERFYHKRTKDMQKWLTNAQNKKILN